MRVDWTALALADIDAIGTYLSGSDPAASERITGRIKEVVALLERHPQLGRPTEYGGARKLVVSGTSYIVIYVLRRDVADIIAVFHSRQARPTRFF